jgi:hypothetical protein
MSPPNKSNTNNKTSKQQAKNKSLLKPKKTTAKAPLSASSKGQETAGLWQDRFAGINQAQGLAVQYGNKNSRPSVYQKMLTPTRPASEARVVGCDFINTYSSLTTASVDNALAVQPYNATTFPKLSGIANNYGKFIFNKVRFIIVGVGPSSIAGAIRNAPVYEDEAAGLTAPFISNRADQVTMRFWESAMCILDCAKQAYKWYTKTESSGDLGIPFYYHIFTDQTTTATVAAELFVEYDVEFCESQNATDPASPAALERKKLADAASVYHVTSVDGIDHIKQVSGPISKNRNPDLPLPPLRYVSTDVEGKTSVLEWRDPREIEETKNVKSFPDSARGSATVSSLGRASGLRIL